MSSRCLLFFIGYLVVYVYAHLYTHTHVVCVLSWRGLYLLEHNQLNFADPTRIFYFSLMSVQSQSQQVKYIPV